MSDQLRSGTRIGSYLALHTGNFVKWFKKLIGALVVTNIPFVWNTADNTKRYPYPIPQAMKLTSNTRCTVWNASTSGTQYTFPTSVLSTDTIVYVQPTNNGETTALVGVELEV